ncbi:MAG: hypothetical protein R3C24_07390 [Cyanobacteriota/Melainabacteria group bacterium]
MIEYKNERDKDRKKVSQETYPISQEAGLYGEVKFDWQYFDHLDSSVLFNRPVTDTLLKAAEYGLYRVHWTQRILDETTGSLIKRSKMNRAQASHLQEELAKAFPEAMVKVPQN